MIQRVQTKLLYKTWQTTARDWTFEKEQNRNYRLEEHSIEVHTGHSMA